MISQIKIKNFQSHKETILDLHEGVNALVGLTGAGKSVVFKALDWFFRNRPLGDEYCSWWGGDTQVELILKEGYRIGRILTNDDDFYYVDKKEFRAFGKGVPQSVLDLLNLSDVNFQAQADPAFLISNSSGEVARYLNRAAHLDVIDGALSNIAGTLRKEKEELSRNQQELEQSQAQLIQYGWLPEAEEKLVRFEELQDHVSRLSDQRLGLTKIVGQHEQTNKELSGLREILKFEVDVEKLVLLDKGIEKQNSQWEALADIVDQYEKVQKELDSLVGITGIEEKWQRMDKLYREILILESNRTGLGQVVRGIEEGMVALSQAGNEEKRLKEEFDRLMPNICPLCDGTGGKKKVI